MKSIHEPFDRPRTSFGSRIIELAYYQSASERVEQVERLTHINVRA
jgi:hypothetical protein